MGPDGVRRGEKTYIHLLGCPCVKIDGLDFADVSAHSTVNTRTTNTQKDATGANMKRQTKEECTRTHIFQEAQRGSKVWG
jgi:hypothetical protein